MARRRSGGDAGHPRPGAAPLAVRRPPADVAAAAFLVAALLAGVQAVLLDDPVRTLRAGVPYLAAFAVVVVVRAVGPRSDDELTPWVRGLAVAGTLLSMWLLGAFLGALPLHLGEPSSFYRIKVAVTSPVGDHNTAAGLLLPTIVACAAMAVREPRWRAGLAATSLGLVATLSRGAALVLLVVAVVGWLVASSRRFAAWLLAAATVAAAMMFTLALVLDASPSADVETPDGVLGASIVGRLDLAERGIEVGFEQPWIGVGLGGFAEAADGLPPPNDHAHQVFAHAFAEGGVWLLGVALVVPVVLARRVLELPAGPGRDVLLLSGLGLLAHAQMEILAGRIGYEVLLALLVGLAGSLGDVPDPRPGARAGTPRRDA
jgi:hypothetical protein